MIPDQFRAYQAELGSLTHGATATLLGVSEVTVKCYAGDDIEAEKLWWRLTHSPLQLVDANPLPQSRFQDKLTDITIFLKPICSTISKKP